MPWAALVSQPSWLVLQRPQDYGCGNGVGKRGSVVISGARVPLAPDLFLLLRFKPFCPTQVLWALLPWVRLMHRLHEMRPLRAVLRHDQVRAVPPLVRAWVLRPPQVRTVWTRVLPRL